MVIEKRTRGETVIVIVGGRASARLIDKNFRGSRYARAGNFSAWNSMQEFFLDRDIQKALLDEIIDATEEGLDQISSFEIEFDHVVGWSSTDDIDKYNPNTLTRFSPNSRSTALKVKNDCRTVLAPTTNILTIVFYLTYENGKYIAVIYNVYPGRDVGDFDGDVTSREKMIFFDWSHPGEVK